jgi:hypothetical protein
VKPTGGLFAAVFLLLFATALGHAEAPVEEPAGVTLKHDPLEKTVEVHVRGEHFTTYHYGGQRHVPFLWPVFAEGGVGMTRNFPMAADEPPSIDHPHHCSLYLTYGDVNGHDFWHVDRGRPGVIRTVKLETGDDNGFSWIRAHNHWLGRNDGALMMEEIQELRFHDSETDGRLFDLVTTFKATPGDVTFGDSKEGMLAYRIRPEIDGDRAGILTNASGQQGESNVYGKPSEWMDYTGVIEGHGKRGIALFDHPDNAPPAQWHVRNYGLVGLNPFGRRSVAKLADGRHTIKQGGSLTLRYRFYIHSGDHEEADVAGKYAEYVKDEAVRAVAH